MTRDLRGTRVMVTGGAGFLGRRIVALLAERGAEPLVVRSADYDLTILERAQNALHELRPDLVVHAAARVGGIGANLADPAGFFRDNALMGIHLIHESWRAGVEKLLAVGTACSYPKDAPIPFREEHIWDGYPEETNAPYGLAKKMLLVQGRAYREQHGFDAIHVIPTNLYGPGDDFELERSHVIPAMIRKCLDAVAAGADEVTLWGTGSPSRDLLHVDDVAEGLVLALERYSAPEPLNLGSNQEITIRDLAEMVAGATGFKGRFVWDAARPDGQPRRAVDGSRAERLLGWRPKIDLETGIAETVAWYLASRE